MPVIQYAAERPDQKDVMTVEAHPTAAPQRGPSIYALSIVPKESSTAGSVCLSAKMLPATFSAMHNNVSAEVLVALIITDFVFFIIITLLRFVLCGIDHRSLIINILLEIFYHKSKNFTIAYNSYT